MNCPRCWPKPESISCGLRVLNRPATNHPRPAIRRAHGSPSQPTVRLQEAVQGVGAMKRALHETINYVKEREAFGRPVLKFQNTQFKLAECKTKATLAEVFVHHCSERLMKGELDAATASMAKYWVSDAQNEVIDECVQLHGGYGYMNEYPIARMWRDSRVQRIYGGTNEIMKLLIARTL